MFGRITDSESEGAHGDDDRVAADASEDVPLEISRKRSAGLFRRGEVASKPETSSSALKTHPSVSLENPAPRRPNSSLPRRNKSVASQVVPVPNREGEEEARAAPDLQAPDFTVERVILEAGEEEVGASDGGCDDEESVGDFVVDGAVGLREVR